MNGGTSATWLARAILLPLAILSLGADTANPPESPEIEWTAGCEKQLPCRVLIEGKQVLITGRGDLRCAARETTLACLFSSRNGRSHDAWFIGLEDRSVHPIRIDPGHALLAEPVWDPGGLRIMLRRSDGSLTTRTVVVPKIQSAIAGLRGWASVVGDPDDEPHPVRLALDDEGLLWTSAGPRFHLVDGSAASPAPFAEAIRDGVSLEALEILAGGDVLLAGGVRNGSQGFDGSAPVKVVGGERGGRDLFLARLESSGKLRWLRTWGSAGDDHLLDLALEGEEERARIEARYGGLVDLDPGEGTKIANPRGKEALSSRFDGEGLLIADPVAAEAEPEGETSEEETPETEAAPAPVEACRLRLGEGPVPRAPRSTDLRLDSDQASTWVGCFEAERPRWMLVVPAGVFLEDAALFEGRLCLGGQARGGPHDLARQPTQNLYVGDPEVESVAFVACLDLEQTLGPSTL